MSQPASSEARLDPILAAFPRERQYLLPALLAVEEATGPLTDAALLRISAHLRVPKSEVEGVADSYNELRLARNARPHAHRLAICGGLTCRLLGAGALLVAARIAPEGWAVEETACRFTCAVGPIAELDGQRVGHARPEQIGAWLAPQAMSDER